ncbi:hypothetical protein K458DRAFT_401650 [Lentithecium fluviatile CBS 122367]|uniref:Uncharacterized protein n=1 Tax=Lentithecium fluviatile CBS 122367 TaxID=1168545 RepID=A0A6G1J925_9PLEO|nr:hypothetical protein K458DRAFT_401650 [Lentithecium fluviatile CBS 122367]
MYVLPALLKSIRDSRQIAFAPKTYEQLEENLRATFKTLLDMASYRFGTMSSIRSDDFSVENLAASPVETLSQPSNSTNHCTSNGVDASATAQTVSQPPTQNATRAGRDETCPPIQSPSYSSRSYEPTHPLVPCERTGNPDEGPGYGMADTARNAGRMSPSEKHAARLRAKACKEESNRANGYSSMSHRAMGADTQPMGLYAGPARDAAQSSGSSQPTDEIVNPAQGAPQSSGGPHSDTRCYIQYTQTQNQSQYKPYRLPKTPVQPTVLTPGSPDELCACPGPQAQNSPYHYTPGQRSTAPQVSRPISFSSSVNARIEATDYVRLPYRHPDYNHEPRTLGGNMRAALCCVFCFGAKVREPTFRRL